MLISFPLVAHLYHTYYFFMYVYREKRSTLLQSRNQMFNVVVTFLDLFIFTKKSKSDVGDSIKIPDFLHPLLLPPFFPLQQDEQTDDDEEDRQQSVKKAFTELDLNGRGIYVHLIRRY